MSATPLIKIASLLVRTLAKPIANKMKKEAGTHPGFSKICVWVGQRLHFVTSRINVLSMGYKLVAVKPLPEEEALAKGVNFLSEAFIFTVAGTVVVAETIRSEHKSALKSEATHEKEMKKEEALRKRLGDINQQLLDIESSLPAVSKAKLEKIRNDRIKAELKAKENLKLLQAESGDTVLLDSDQIPLGKMNEDIVDLTKIAITSEEKGVGAEKDSHDNSGPQSLLEVLGLGGMFSFGDVAKNEKSRNDRNLGKQDADAIMTVAKDYKKSDK